MNIVRALDVALPELPQQLVRKSPPKLDPRVIAKEHVEKGKSLFVVKMPGTEFIFRFSPLQWTLMQLFDGNRSYDAIVDEFATQTGTQIAEDDVKELVNYLQAESEILCKTTFEKNITLQQELRASRKKRNRFAVKDFSDITIKTWSNADDYITWLYPRLRFLFTPWFVWTSIAMFVLMGWMWAERFGEIWNDSFAFYNFIHKSGSDLFEFWILFGAMAAVHETAHGLTGKHFGATIEKMGFSLMYFAPSFFCDATQVWVMGGKWARIATSIAGIWLDLVLCFFATIIWWATPTGMAVHDWAYKIMMVTGIGVSLLNLNPLIKLDGYLIFCELVAEPSLKETSTLYVSSWVRRHIFRLPAEVLYVPRRKRLFFAIYAILSGIYSYSLLSFLMLLAYNILRSFTPEWAFLPSVLIGVWVFRSRIRMMENFTRAVYLDKKERIRMFLRPWRLASASLALLVFIVLPIWPEYVRGPFVISSAQKVPVRATQPGTVVEVAVHEGERVTRGASLLRLRNLAIQSQADEALANLRVGTAKSVAASQRYVDFGSAESERKRLEEDNRVSAEKALQLEVSSPIPGTVLTPRMADMVGRTVDDGDLLLELADTSKMKAHVYLPEFSMRDLRLQASVRMLPEGKLSPLRGTLDRISPVASVIPDGLIPKESLQGITPPSFYMGEVSVESSGELKEGMTGLAKVLVGHASLAKLTYKFTRDLVERKIW